MVSGARQLRFKPLLSGLITVLPGTGRLRAPATGGSDSARYCYSVWMRHLLLARAAGLSWPVRSVAELGPGDSLGIGLAALLSGCERYIALDAVGHARRDRDERILDELVALFRAGADIPGGLELPEVKPALADLQFPRALLGPALAGALSPVRLARLHADLAGAGPAISYRAPWMDAAVLEPGSVDFLFSQAVLEHVDDLSDAYAAMHRWLRPGGFMSHQIDFRSHGTARDWNGHWTYPRWMWRVIRGRRPYLLNREPRSTHARLLAAQGFEVLADQCVRQPSSVRREHLAAEYRGLSDDDLQVSGWFVVARKRS